MNRRQFINSAGQFGLGACMCAAAGGMSAALAEEAPPKKPEAQAAPEPQPETQPGDKTVARAAKRMEFADGWVKRFFDAVDQNLDEPTRKRLMEANGRSCFTAYAGPRRHPPAADAVERFSKWVAEEGAKHGYSMEGRVIHFEYLGSAETGKASPECICLCPLVEAQVAGQISPTYCHCSVGYVKEMHERRLGRPVQVELVDSILRGGRRCKFQIMVS
ncbi:MAG TPA: hypothetical protein VMS93_05900 [Candidatus Saccharimonadales bacterium]|nr:hypothetical protein [Candidatus Saccharimonadales bacterium]